MSVDLGWGPHEDPEVLGEAPIPEGPEPVALEDPVHIDESVVRSLLQSVVGGGLGFVAGDPDVPDHWRFTERELNDLTPPLCRYINARPRLRAAVIRGDQLAMVTVLAGYAGRNIAAGRAAASAREDRDAHERREDQGPVIGPAYPAGPASAPAAGPAHGGHGAADG